MTRATKRFRKQYLEPSGFTPKDLIASNLPPSSSSSSSATDPPTVTADCGQKRKAEDVDAVVVVDQETQAAAAVTAAEIDGGNNNIKKKKKMRHRSSKEAGDAEIETMKEGDAQNQHQKKKILGGQEQLSRKDREVLKRRTRREKLKEKKMTCFLCRNKGHSIKFCPKANTTDIPTNPKDALEKDLEGSVVEGICYRCGSTEHKLAECKKKANSDNPYPFATCFICKQQGHISGHCPENDRGLYPNGGGCRFCGSVRHLAKDCKPSSSETGVTVLGTMDLAQGGDDDDVFVALKKMQDEKVGKKVLRAEMREEDGFDRENSKGVLVGEQPAIAPAPVSVKPKPKVVKKVVSF
ncbi:hypothetical protein HDV05_006358 [Chytridiales sp. JEL 0842]|nr:hypothetical protein HDV05_006358 [Chytridiales sp. JEL 0842]